VRWAFKDGSPEFRNGGIVVGRVTDVEPLAAFSYVNGPAGEQVAFDDPKARIQFATVTVAVEEGWLPIPADEVKVALRLSGEDTWEAQREALLSDWGTAVAVLSTPFRWTGIEKPDIYAPGLWGAGFGRVTVDGTLRFDGLEAAGSEWMMADIETVQDLRDAAAQEPRVVMLDNPTIFR
jgi:hypothetical protein